MLALTATLGVALPARAGLFGISEQEEIQAGREVAAQAEKEYGGVLPYNDRMSVRVRAIGQQFARLSTRKNIPYSYKVLNNNKILNAFAAPGGPVYVTKKLMETTANDAELAYVLGHETGHIERKHIVQAAAKQQKVGLGLGILGAILGRGSGGNIIGTIANVGFTVWSRGYSRDQESEADTVGVRWMSQLGYDPRAAISMLGKLGGGGGGLDKYLSTHPAPKTRQENVSRLIAKENLLDVARRQGGPRLSDAGSDSGAHYADYPADAYPTATNTSDPAYYPPDDGGSPNSYPPEDASQPAYYPPDDRADDGELDFGAPLRLRTSGRDDVVMAPVEGFAAWANAAVSTRGDATTVRRGDNSLEFRTNSTVAYVNGRAETMSAPAVLYGDTLYAPLGYLASGVGAEATIDEDARIVRLRLDDRDAFVRLP
jgi:Zn-dependent protease with chaperone function